MAIQFDGVDDTLYAGSVPGNPGAGQFTVVAYIMSLNQSTRQWPFIMGNANNGERAGYDAWDGDGQLKPYWGGNATGAFTMSLNTWYHTALVRNGSNQLVGYLNGAVNASSAGVMGTLGNIYFSLASANNGGFLFANCRLAELAVYSYALSTTEIGYLNRGISPRKYNPQNLYYYSRLLNENHYLDIKRGLSLTKAGAPSKADHPRIYG